MKINRTLSTLLALVLLLAAPASLYAQTAQQGGIPTHPRELKYTTLTYTPPKRDRHRHVLSNGVVVYAVEDHDCRSSTSRRSSARARTSSRRARRAWPPSSGARCAPAARRR
jgi:hypothetical protein